MKVVWERERTTVRDVYEALLERQYCILQLHRDEKRGSSFGRS